MKGVDAIAKILKLEGVEYLFCFPANTLIEACAKVGIRPIIGRTERAIVNAADGYTRISNRRRIGVCAVQHGPGSENSFAGIAQAFADSSPILFLPGGYEHGRAGVGPHFEAPSSYQHITKWASRIPLPERIPDMMRWAFSQAKMGRPAPVLLEVPTDIANAEIDESTFNYKPVKVVRLAPDAGTVKEAVWALLAAECPLICAGQGVLYAEATEELRELAELLHLPVVVTMPGKGAFPENHPLSCGAAGRSFSAMADHFRNKADLVLAVGCSLTRNPYAMPYPPGKVFIHVTVNEADINKEYYTEYPMIADAKLALQQIIEEVKRQSKGRPARSNGVAKEIKEIKETWMAKWLPALTSDEKPINPYRVIWEMMHAVDRTKTIVTHEAGYPRDQMVPFWETLTPNTYIGWGKTTQLGSSLGFSLGAKLAAPDKTVIAVQGDAAIGMSGMDIETASRERIPITIVVLNNGVMTGYIRYLPVASEKYGARLLTGDYTKLAESLGAYAERVVEPNEVGPAVQRAIKQNEAGRPALIECMVSEYPHVSTF